MKKLIYFLSLILFIASCKKKEATVFFSKYDEITELKEQQNHKLKRMQFKLIQSKYLDMNEVFKPFQKDLATFSERDYNALKPLILEKNIPSLQKNIKEGSLTYEKLTLFYLYRIRKFESDSTKFLNAIIALNPNVVKEAREMDKNKSSISEYSIFGMPILLKDNINTKEMPTTAGAIATFTSRGPSIAGTLKPEITAPGTAILTAYPGGGDALSPISGTSFSSPITAGAMSIVREALPERNAMEIKATMMNSANLDVTLDPKGLNPDAELAPISYIGSGLVDVEKTVVYISIADKLLFKSGSATISSKAKGVLGKVAEVIGAQENLEVMVEGYTDNKKVISNSSIKDNWDLSVKRATSVIRVLQKDFNIAPERLLNKKPVASPEVMPIP